MRHPLRQNARRIVVTSGDSISAPVAGWNQRDPLFGMDPRFATILDNYFPQTGSVDLRGGHSSHATGVGSGAVETLLGYFSATTKQLIATGGGSVYNATAGGAATSLGSGFSEDRWQGFNFGNRLLMFNGTDAPRDWDGTTLSATAWTGLTIANLIGGIGFKHRVHLIEKDTANIWIGGVDAVTGALTQFDLSLVHPSGGNVIAVGSITLDGGDGPDDIICYFMDRGDVILYAGTNPTAAFPDVAWSLVGIFKIGRVVGRRPLVKKGGDLIAITADGYVPILQFIKDRTQLAISDNISGAVNEAIRSFSDNLGWEAVLYPKANWLLFNVPLVQDSQSVQHVMNTRTGAWCRFKGMNAASWEEFDDKLYFGGTGGNVYLADDTLADNGAFIEGDAQTAWVYLGGRGRQKHFKMFRPMIASDSELPIEIGLGVDFIENIPLSTASAVTTEGAVWDVATWDVADWAGGFAVNRDWQSAGNIGYAAAVRVRTETKAQRVKWFSTDFLHEPGSVI